MPRLLAFLACNQAIISRDDDTVSLITVMQGINATIDESLAGQNILLPHQWAIFSYWLKEAGDEGATFEQRIELFGPDNSRLVSQDSEFAILRATHSQVGRLAALPVPQARSGELRYDMRISIRRVGEQVFVLKGEFPLVVTLLVGSSETVSR